jgi:5S rRNA maturation endonuclease (ribonuclease M5)
MDDVEQILDQLNIVVRSKGRELSAECPFHTDSHPSFSINANSGLWICYQCGRAGTLEMLIQEITGETATGASLLREVRRRPKKAKEELEAPQEIDINIVRAIYASLKTPPSWACEERSFGRAEAKEYSIKWDHGWVLPIWDPEGVHGDVFDLWGWQYKQIDFHSNFPKTVKKSMTLFGLREFLWHGDGNSLILVESPLDVVRLATVGLWAVASFGAIVSKRQMELLIDATDRVVLALDNDDAGREATKRIYRPLIGRVHRVHVVTERFPDKCKDPGEMSDKQIEKVFG